jgi:hypothetical protein
MVDNIGRLVDMDARQVETYYLESAYATGMGKAFSTAELKDGTLTNALNNGTWLYTSAPITISQTVWFNMSGEDKPQPSDTFETTDYHIQQSNWLQTPIGPDFDEASRWDSHSE